MAIPSLSQTKIPPNSFQRFWAFNACMYIAGPTKATLTSLGSLTYSRWRKVWLQKRERRLIPQKKVLLDYLEPDLRYLPCFGSYIGRHLEYTISNCPKMQEWHVSVKISKPLKALFGVLWHVIKTVSRLSMISRRKATRTSHQVSTTKQINVVKMPL